MKIKMYQCIIGFMAGIATLNLNAAVPNWTVNPKAYQFSMNITGVFVSNCAFVSNNANKIAAFVNGELRGVADFKVSGGGKTLAFLTIYSNQASGEVVSFQAYNQATDKVVSIPVQTTFSENTLLGNMQQPFQLYTDTTIGTNIEINKTQGIFRLSASSSCANATSYTYQLVSGTGSDDNALFSINQDQLVPVGGVSQTLFNIRVKATANSGLSFEKAFTLQIFATGINENSSIKRAQVYPNPLSGNNVFVDLPGVTLYSAKFVGIDGRTVGEYEFAGTHQFVAEVPAGFYQIEITTDKGVFYSKLVKE